MTSAELRRAAELLRTLARLEYAHATGPGLWLDDDLRKFLDPVDGLEVWSLAAELEVEATFRAHGITRQGTRPGDRRSGSRVLL